MNTKFTWLQQVPEHCERGSDAGHSGSSLETEWQANTKRSHDDTGLQSSDDEIEYVALDVANVGAWIEAQLLDCQNLARQHGLTQIADTLDDVLNQIEHDVAAGLNSSAKLVEASGDEFDATGWACASSAVRGAKVKLC